jgi:hypothetical protein
MSAAEFANGVRSLLTDDVVFAAGVRDLIGTTPSVLRGNPPFQQIPAGQWPCWVLEQGDGNAHAVSEEGGSFLTIGAREAQFQSDLMLALVWKNDDREAAADQRAQLPALLAQLMLRNPQPGGVLAAWLEGWKPDRAALHPVQLWTATLRSIYSIEATP